MININNSFFFSKKGFDFGNCKNFKKNLEIAKKKSEEIYKEFSLKNNEVLQSFTASYQKKIRNIINILDYQNKKKIVIGLGGSSSGAKALSFFVRDEIIFFDNLDYEFFKSFFENNNIKDYIFFIISKSGNTFETLALLNLLLLESKKINDYNLLESMIIITENKDSILKNFSNKNNIKYVEHNPNIGGRFSVLSETGMLLFSNKKEIIVEDASEKFINLLENDKSDLSPTRNVAIMLSCIEKVKLNICCNLIYNYRLKYFSYWFHQLHAESLGKNGKGLTPITSICPKDHHSMMQLYLDGPKDKIFNIFSPPDENFYESFEKKNFYNIENYTPKDLLDKQFKSVIEIFHEKKIPHRVFEINDHKNPLNLIELFSYFLLETILLGKAMNIDPYNQPAVQLIKDKIFKS